MIPGLETRLMDGSDVEIRHIAELVSAFSSLVICHGLDIRPDPERGFQRKVR
jgi:hypothetical protein